MILLFNLRIFFKCKLPLFAFKLNSKETILHLITSLYYEQNEFFNLVYKIK